MKQLLTFVLLLLLWPAIGLAPIDHLPAESRSDGQRLPNIVFILTDDLNVEVFSRLPRMPSLLVERGTTFRNHFVSLSLCCPSRTAILRGQYAHNTGIFTNMPPNGGFQEVFARGLESSTVATWLQDAGYRTVLMGKYLNGYPTGAGMLYVPPGWDEWYSPNGGSPYSEFNYRLNENGVNVSYGSQPEDYMVDVLSAKASDFIERSVASDPNQPFFMYIATYAPHQPATPAPRYENEFPGAQAPRTPSFNVVNPNQPQWVSSRPPLTRQQINAIDALYRKRLQSMLAVEDLIDNLIQTLEATGQLDNTYIFFTSDNGFHQGQHRLVSGKNTGFDEDLFVPLIVRGPGVPAGVTLDPFTLNIDFAPTFAELGGAAPTHDVDGRSLVPLLAGNPPCTSWRQSILLEHRGLFVGATPAQLALDPTLEPPDLDEIQPLGGTAGAPIFVGVRTVNHTYIEYVTNELELYEHSSDPDQLDNKAQTADPALLDQLATRLSALRDCAGDACRAAEDLPAP